MTPGRSRDQYSIDLETIILEANQLKRAVQQANTHVQRVCDAAYARFLGKKIQGLEEKLCQRDQREPFQHLVYLRIEDKRKLRS